MNTWGSKHVGENSILWINNNQCIKLVINIESIYDARSEKTASYEISVLANIFYAAILLFLHPTLALRAYKL